MKIKLFLKKHELEDKVFHYLDWGSEAHGRRSFRLWVNRRLISQTEGTAFVEFPVQNAGIVKTERGTLVLRPVQGVWTGYFFKECGYRGDSTIEVLSPTTFLARYYEYRSPRGSCGISEGVLFSTREDKVLLRWSRTGRLYSKPAAGTVVLFPDGREQECECTPEQMEELEELL